MKIALTAAIAAAAVLAPAAMSFESQAKTADYYYQYYFYSDATKTYMVGQFRQYCLNNNTIITPLVTGTMTEHYTREAIGICPGLGDW